MGAAVMASLKQIMCFLNHKTFIHFVVAKLKVRSLTCAPSSDKKYVMKIPDFSCSQLCTHCTNIMQICLSDVRHLFTLFHPYTSPFALLAGAGQTAHMEQ